MIQHITPVNDLKAHLETSYMGAEGEPEGFPTCDCRCNPERKYLEESDSWLFIHNSWDGREGVEWAVDILNGK